MFKDVKKIEFYFLNYNSRYNLEIIMTDILNNNNCSLSWDDYYSDSDEQHYETFDNYLTVDELNIISKKNIKYVKYPMEHNQNAPVPINFRELIESSKKNVKENVDKKDNQENINENIDIKRFLKWISCSHTEEIYLNQNTHVIEKPSSLEETLDDHSEDDHSEDDEYLYKLVNKTTPKNTIPNKKLVTTIKTLSTNNTEQLDNWLLVKTKDKKQNIKINDLHKTKLCKNKICNIKNCFYAHSFEELVIKNCLFNNNCKNIKLDKGIFYNRDPKNICNFIHDNETKSNYKFRLGLSKDLDLDLDLNETSKSKKSFERSDVFTILSDKNKMQNNLMFTKLCKYFKENLQCPHKDGCRFAHSLDQLRISNCLFNNNCRLVKFQNGKIYNVSKTKFCEHLHEDLETLETYYSRIGMRQHSENEKNLSIKKISL